MRIKVAPSLLSADFSCLGREIKKVEQAGADMLHIDVMDGHFVPNISIGPGVVKWIHNVATLPLDVHLMIENPGRHLQSFIDAGSDMITVHVETVTRAQVRSFKSRLHRVKVRLGVSLNPNTPLSKIKGLLNDVDFVLVMSVFPGFGGQKFMPLVLPKIRQLRAIFKGDISVDGGVNDENAQQLIQAGANILASGSFIFSAKDAKTAIERIKNADA